MFNIRKNYNNEDNTYNQNNYQNQPSLGSISKKSTKRQMTRPYLNTKYSDKLNEYKLIINKAKKFLFNH